ncbi:hypothetical protein B4121_2283 [Bacillus paralicheniformis]|uniref:Uncharacterized protein n=1 Tax=Bacillus paralicheniformis TaxID=1648923 RepID=A0A7Z1B3K1_9BACI|nr:hypothetical protein B4121_2283 [Bacillus paralicheniformis]
MRRKLRNQIPDNKQKAPASLKAGAFLVLKPRCSFFASRYGKLEIEYKKRKRE